MLVYAGQGKSLKSGDYTINRFSRLYPLHFATLIYVTVLQLWSQSAFDGYQIYQINDVSHFVMQFFFISGWGFEDGNSFNGPIWSVSAEIFTYIVFLFYVRLVPVNFMSLIAAFCVSYAIAIVTSLIVFICLSFFFGGCLTYAIIWMIQQRKFKYGLVAAVSGFCAFVVIDQVFLSIGRTLPYTIRLQGYFGFLIVVLALIELDFPRLNLRRFRGIGDISYATYLLHSPIQMTFLMCVAWGLVDLSVVLSPVFALLYFAFVIWTSHLVFRYFEKPAQSKIRALKTRDTKVTSA